MHDPVAQRGLIFWREPFRAAGPRAPAQVVADLNSRLAERRFSLSERLVGRFDGIRMTLWRKSVVSFGGDVIEFDGELRAENGGSVIEGSLQYKRAAKIQFVGLLIFAAALVAIGALQYLGGKETGENVLGFGTIVLLVVLVWVYSSSQMRGEQMRFIEEHLKALVNR